MWSRQIRLAGMNTSALGDLTRTDFSLAKLEQQLPLQFQDCQKKVHTSGLMQCRPFRVELSLIQSSQKDCGQLSLRFTSSHQTCSSRCPFSKGREHSV